ncbi:unnamed protein product [Euphydryas editha]|uniref:Uncharacterized protein n=1 Tax=Euphydryas editha TaxID=104508 RepID=A0AAU9UD46_EUPED|nr:unnamed protein product [Euphydryas editha]
MAFIQYHLSVYVFLVFLIVVDSFPTCKYVNEEETEVVCNENGDTSYALTQRLVSDNNKTISISLKGCKISSIDDGSFHNFLSLKYLDLSQNQITELKIGALDGANQLIYLNLSNNFLSEIRSGLFNQTINLNTLDLTGNKLKQLKQGAFDNLQKLGHLGLSNNNLQGKDLDPFLFNHNTHISYIDFSANEMNGSPDTLLSTMQALEFLNLERCLLNEVPTFVTRRNLITMKTLILSKNEISKLDNPTIFINLENLMKLNLAENILDQINADVFKPLKKLKVIVLRENKIKYLPENLFQNMKNLANIDLSHNLIESVPVNAFRGTSVKNLNLSNNRFTYLSDNFCLELRNSGAKLTKFYFNQNPWQCTCLMSLLNEVKKLEISYNSLYYDGKYPVCVTTKEIFCKRHDSFNSIYTELYDDIASAEN